MLQNIISHRPSIGGSRGGRRPAIQILSISCSFWEILAKSYVAAPSGGLAPLPWGNHGFATAIIVKTVKHPHSPKFPNFPQGVVLSGCVLLLHYVCK